jgi:hypothetical protein
MMAVLQRLNAGSFFLYSLLSVFIFLALVLKVCRNRFSCHGQSVAEPVPSKLSNFGHSLKFMAVTRKWRVQTLATKRQRSSRSWRCTVEGGGGAFGPQARTFRLAVALSERIGGNEHRRSGIVMVRTLVPNFSSATSENNGQFPQFFFA